jgi:hypothetical protein
MADSKRTDLTILLNDSPQHPVRLSYFYGFRPMESTNDKGQKTQNYCTHAILGPSHPDVAKLVLLMKEAAKAAWGTNADAVYAQLKAQDRLAVHVGDVSKPGQDGYAGNMFVSANSKVRPTIIDGNRVQLTESDGRPYSGCYGNVMVNIWAQATGQYGKRINAQLMGVQFTRHGDAFGGGRVAAPEEFGIVAGDMDGPAPATSGGQDPLA